MLRHRAFSFKQFIDHLPNQVAKNNTFVRILSEVEIMANL